MEEEKKIVPIYALTEDTSVSPIHRKVSKTMEITETFSIFDVMSYIAKMKKRKEDLEGELKGLDDMITAYEDELELIEEKTGVQKMEEEYQKQIALENEAKQKELESAVVAEVIKQREEASEGIPSPYVEENN